MKNKFYITTAIPYVNAPPHVGHALEFVQTDVLARHARVAGKETFFLTGSDDNALKNVRAAEEAGVSTKELVDKYSDAFEDFARELNINVDGYQRGSDEKLHWPGVQWFWKKLEEKGDIYKKSYSGFYCVGHAAFVTEKDLDENGNCPDHGTKPEKIEEENYFFKLSGYGKALEKLIESNELQVVPRTRKNEVLSFIRQGLEDISISRTKERARGWGVPVPDDPDQFIYVWVDALNVYTTGVGLGRDEKSFAKWWPADVHVIGKDIIRFHAVYWPAMLLSAGLALPKTIFVHGFVTSEGRKMSKTLGNVIKPLEYSKKYGVDALRYYLLAEIPTLDDGDFSEDQFKRRYNADLANGLGNLTARILTLAEGNEIVDQEVTDEVNGAINDAWQGYEKSFSSYDIKKAVESAWRLIHFLDGYVEKTKPWETKDENVIYNLLAGLANIAWLITPMLPETAGKIFLGLGIDPAKEEGWSFKAQKLEPLFPKVDG